MEDIPTGSGSFDGRMTALYLHPRELRGRLSGTFHKEDGAIVMLNEREKTFSKLLFSGATAQQFRVNYSSRMKGGLATILTGEAKEIVTDNDLYT